MLTTPATIANQALDAIGLNPDNRIGDLEEGTEISKVCLRAYEQCLRQLLRGANWDFARKTAPLVLLADASGQTQNVGNMVPVPWIYEYAYPIDCLKIRFIPFNGYLNLPVPGVNIQLPPPPSAPGSNFPSLIGTRLVPAPFLVATDYNYPPDAALQYEEVQGQSQSGRTVVLTNMQNAQAIYTAFIAAPSVWDSLFRSAFVAYLASEICLSLWHKDIKAGMAIRNEQIKIAKAKIEAARIADGNEGMSSTDHLPDFMRVRSWGTAYGGSAVGPGGIGYGGGDCGGGWGWDMCGFSDGSVY